MPTPTHCPRGRGFTLIELLVVLVIVGVMLSLASLAFRPASASAHDQAQRLHAALNSLRQEAVMMSQDMGVYLTKEGYLMARWDRYRWLPLGPPFQEFSLPPPVEQELLVNGVVSRVTIKKTADRKRYQLEENPPQILLFASGEVSPFQWRFRDDEEQWQVSGNPLGEWTLEQQP